MAPKILVFVVILMSLLALAAKTVAEPAPAPAFVQAKTPEQAGRFLILAADCNGCHTPGYMETGGNVPESQWLTGVPLGWRGPWGTTYASNLRLFVQPFTEDQFVEVIRKRNSRPPMPWSALHSMSDRDLKAIYRYIKSLGATGKEMPAFVPPDQEPRTPYLSLMPVMPAKKAAATQPVARAQISPDPR